MEPAGTTTTTGTKLYTSKEIRQITTTTIKNKSILKTSLDFWAQSPGSGATFEPPHNWPDYLAHDIIFLLIYFQLLLLNFFLYFSKRSLSLTKNDLPANAPTLSRDFPISSESRAQFQRRVAQTVTLNRPVSL